MHLSEVLYHNLSGLRTLWWEKANYRTLKYRQQYLQVIFAL